MGTEDPYDPGFTPTYEGSDPQLGDVGSGHQFGADLYYLYRAGRLDMPRLAKRYSGFTSRVDERSEEVRGQKSLVGWSGGSAVNAILDMAVDLQLAFYRTTNNLTDCGTALVQIADRYAATDQAAAEEFNTYLADVRGDFSGPPVDVPSPPKPSADS